ncbi:Glycosyl_transferase family 2 protein [Hexamita inflata]|uniref:Glycosyl transferase family 2 protein n=1 Tax=Hexamita inflata TaxID=28002 RepID=A0AA86NAK7_9EUKA|nr:Glycosyl transferase family 2 protein [Hexamita inflata]
MFQYVGLLFMERIMFSIVLPAYNQGKNLQISLPNILNQSYGNFEVICVNDGSTDDTAAVIKSFQHDSRIILVNQEYNKGTLSTRLLGAKTARGSYILQFDPDDQFTSNNVLQQLADQLQSITPDMLHFRMRHLFEPPIYKIEPYHWANPRVPHINNENLLFHLLVDDLSHMITGKLFKNEVYQKSITDLFELEKKHIVYIDDFALVFALVHHSKTYFASSIEGYDYYSYEDSVMGRLSQLNKCLKYLQDTRNVYEASYKIVKDGYDEEFVDFVIRQTVSLQVSRLYEFSQKQFEEKDVFNMCRIVDSDYLNDEQYEFIIERTCGYNIKWKTDRKCWVL